MNYDVKEVERWRESAELLQMLHVKSQFKILVLGIVQATDVVPNGYSQAQWAESLFAIRNIHLQEDGGISGEFDGQIWSAIWPDTTDARTATLQQTELLRALFNERHLRRARDRYNAYKADCVSKK